MPKIDLVDNMRKAPGTCGICHTTPNDPDGKPLPAIDTNVDVDWGNNLYICHECIDVICDLAGRVTPDTHDKLRESYDQLDKDHDRLRNRFKKLEERANRMAEGKKASREQRIKNKRRKAA